MGRVIDMTPAMALADRLNALLKAGAPSRYDDPGAYEKTIAALEAAVTSADPKGRLDQDWQGGVLRAFGLRASSTTGIYGACQNWIRQVQAKASSTRHPATTIGE
jgi:hypothetical protein